MQETTTLHAEIKKKKYFVVKVTFNMIFTRTNEAGVGVLLNENVD